MRPNTATILLCAVLVGCGASSSSSPSWSTTTAPASTAAVGSAPTVAVITTTAAPCAVELARRHAPLYRFHAWIAGDGSPQNQSENFFPMSVSGFLDDLAAGHARVAIKESDGGAPGVNEERTFSGNVVIGDDRIDGAPEGISGDVPGTAPVYVHVFEDASRRVRNADLSGEDIFFVEYWLFYGQDRGHLRIAAFGTSIGGHRGDWEPSWFEVAVVRGPGEVVLRSEVRRGFYGRHSSVTCCEADQVERVDDSGAPRADGNHPVVYVSSGKHATYPEPGLWHDEFGPGPIAGMDDFFMGNGFAWPSWTCPVLDLEGPATSEFVTPSWAAMLAPSVAAKGLLDWRAWPGQWGSDHPIWPFAGSPPSARFESNYGLGDRNFDVWNVLRSSPGLVIRRDPPVVPPPLPIRR